MFHQSFCKICIQRVHCLDLFLGPFQLLEALSLVLIGCSFWVQRNLPPKRRKENSERERERALPSKGTAESCPGQTHPQTPLFSWANGWIMSSCMSFVYLLCSLSLSLSLLIRVAPSYEGTNQNSTCPTNSKKNW
jgi:hypothetical protein